MATVGGSSISNIRPTGEVGSDVRKAVADGAHLIDLGQASAAAVASVRAIEPEVFVCADAAGADLTRDRGVADRTGATLLLPVPAGTDTAELAQLSDSRGEVVVATAPAGAARLAKAGWHVLVDVDAPDDAAAAAVAAICVWLGAKIIRTRNVAAVRQAADMVESIRGTRAPFWTRRGLA